MSKMTCLVGGLVLVCLVTPGVAETIISSGDFGGHHYELVDGSMNWDVARDAAADRTWNGVNGYLACVGSQAENDFLYALLPDANLNPWIGGYSDASNNYAWTWVNGDPWNYENWSPEEPSAPPGYYALGVVHMWGRYTWYPGQWNDNISDYAPGSGGKIDAYFVEYTPEPATVSLLALGGLAMIHRRRP